MQKMVILVIGIMFSFTVGAQNADCRCCSDQHTQFDFWIGNWQVVNPDGSAAGRNVIEKIQGDCVLRENWQSAKGNYTGTSTNFYNSKTEQWEQLWVDNQGGSLHLKGQKKENQMILETVEQINKDGLPFVHRITWTHNDDGSVRQYWEVITNGTDITVAFDGLYRKDQ
jgi:hypothetical protein